MAHTVSYKNKTGFDQLQTDFAWSHHILGLKNNDFCGKIDEVVFIREWTFIINNMIGYVGDWTKMRTAHFSLVFFKNVNKSEGKFQVYSDKMVKYSDYHKI